MTTQSSKGVVSKRRRNHVRLLLTGALISIVYCAVVLAQTDPGTRAGFEIHGRLYSGSAPAESEPGDGWAQGQSFLGVLDADGNAVAPFNARRQLDQNWGSQGDGVDSTKFSGSSNKNDDLIGAGQDPWDWGAGGGGPRKNDITNTYFHTRVDSASNHRWVFIGAETRSTGGDSHVDFEFNQAGIQQLGEGSGQLIGNGPDGGRTLGDFIVSIDFMSGGELPTTTLRHWNGSAFVEMPNGEGAVVSAANFEDIAHGSAGAWKHFDQSGATVEVIKALQLVESGIDLTAMGITLDGCSTEATFTVKTRSSSSFSSTLKDFVLVPFPLLQTPQASASNSGPVCEGDAVQLFAGPDGQSYSWSGPGDFASSEQNPVVTPAVAGEYCVTVANADGCSDSACTEVVVVTLPVASASNSGPLCEGDDVQLFGGPDGLSYSWTGPNGYKSTAQNPVVSPAVAGEYCLTVADDVGCADSACTEVVVSTIPVATASNSGPVCEGGDVQLLAGPDGLSYSWTGPDDFASSEQNPVVPAALPGQYCVTVSDEVGCSDTACTDVENFLNPDCFIFGPDFVCAGSSCNMFDGPQGASAGQQGPHRVAFGSSPPVRYGWGIEGDGMIVGPDDGPGVFVDPIVDIAAPGGGGAQRTIFGGDGEVVGEFTLFLTTTSAEECESMCELTVPVLMCEGEELITCEGCSPGHWKQTQHLGNWTDPYSPDDLFSETMADEEVFEDAFPNMTLLEVLHQGGGGLNALGRQTVAALLNSVSLEVNFPFPPVTIITMFNDVYPGTDMDYALLKDQFQEFNTIGCPLGSAPPNAPGDGAEAH